MRPFVLFFTLVLALTLAGVSAVAGFAQGSPAAASQGRVLRFQGQRGQKPLKLQPLSSVSRAKERHIPAGSRAASLASPQAVITFLQHLWTGTGESPVNQAAPDATIAAGPDRIVTAVTDELKVTITSDSQFGRKGDVFLVDLKPFVGAGGASFVMWPRLSYIPNPNPFNGNRGNFVLAAAVVNSGNGVGVSSSIVLAVSTNDHPTASPNSWRFVNIGTFSTVNNVNFYGYRPHVGWDDNALYLTWETVAFSSGSLMPTAKAVPANATNNLLAVSRSFVTTGSGQALQGAGVPLPTTAVDPNAPYAAGTLAWGLRAAEPLAGMPRGVLVSAGRPGNAADGRGIALYYADFVTTPTPGLTLTLRWVDNQFNRFINAANNPVGTGYTDLSKAMVANNVLWTSHTVGVQGDSTPRARVYRVQLTPGTGAASLASFHDLTDFFTPTFYPVVVPDAFGNAVAAFNSTSFDGLITMAHARYVGFTGQFEPITTAATSLSFWGDFAWGAYNDGSPDRTLGGRAWVHAELAASNFTWETRVAQLLSRATTVLTPNGGEAYLFGEDVTVTWTPGVSSTTGQVAIQISYDGGQSWTTVQDSVADAAGQFTFTAAPPASTRARIRVISQNSPGNYDVNFADASDGDFAITNGVRNTFCTDDEVPAPAPVQIPDNWTSNADWAVSPLYFPADMVIAGISTKVDITHAFQQDLQIFLIPPDAPIPQDIANSGLSTNQLAQYAVRLKDQTGGANAFSIEEYPIPNAYAEPLANARAKTIGKRSRFWDNTGKELPWRLLVRDLKSGDAGQINEWCLTITGPEKQRLVVTYPNGGERLDIGSTQRITWTNDSDNPVDGDVNLYLSTNGTTFSNIPLNPSPIPADVQFFDWVVPNTPTSTALIQIRSTVDLAQQDTSDSVFSIEPASLTVLDPNGGEVLVSGRPHLIRWDSVPLTGSVNIALSTDSGASFPTTIAATAPNVGSYTWNVPADLVTTTARIRVTANTGPARSDVSDADFSIRQQSITVTSPNATGIRWYTANPQTVTWTSTGLTGNVTIELSKVVDAGGGRTDWTSVGTAAVGAGTFTFTPTAPGSTTALIRVTSVTDPAVSDVSDNPFELREATITVTRPAAGEKLAVSFPYTIQWTSEGLPAGNDNVDIEISRNNSPFAPLFSNVANDGAETWVVTGPQRDNVLIRVKARNVPVSGVSGSFAIVGPSVTVTNPNGGERVAVGRTHQIQWTATPTQGTVTIKLSRNSGASYDYTIVSGAANSGSYDWSVPTEINGSPIDTTTARILVSVDGSPFPAQTDFSDADFIIETPRVTVQYPNGGEIWYTHTTEVIRYQTVGITGTVQIQLSRAADQNGNRTDWTTLGFAPASANGTFDYTVTGPAANNVAVRVVSVNEPSALDVSDSALVIREMGVTLLSPNGGEVWGVGTTRTVTWSTAGVPGTVNLLLSTDGGGSFSPLVSATANDGTEDIVVPNAPSENVILKVQANGFPPFDVSDAVFSIVNPVISVIQPNGGEEFRVGQTYTLEWSSKGLAGNVQVELSTDGGGNWSTLFPSEPASGTKSWSPTGADTSNALIRVTSLELPAISDTSDAPFTIVSPAFTLLTPNGGERWFIGSTRSITWTTKGVDTSAKVRVDISRDGGSYETLIPETENDGTVDIQVAGPASTNTKIRIVSLDGSGAMDESDAGFTILASTLRVLSPNGGLEWLTGSRQTITWSSDGVPNDALINVYLLGPGKGDRRLILAQVTNDGTEAWTVDGANGSSYQIQLEWVGRPEVNDTSDSTFTISAPEIRVTSPGGGNVWKVGQLATIRWEGSAVRVGGGQVDVQISRDNGRTFQNLAQDTRNDGSLTITVTGPATTKARIRVIWKPNTAVRDTSGKFTIKKKANRR